MIEVEAGKLSGIITMRKGRNPESMVEVAKFPNMILDSGLRLFRSTTEFMTYVNVGSSSVAVLPSQTGLQNKLHHSNTTVGKDITGADTSDPVDQFVYRIRTLRIPPKGAPYNVAEVGFGSDTNNTCYNRALVLQDGNPTSISVLGDEYLDVTLEVRLYPPATDFTGTLTPTGKDLEERTWVARVGMGTAAGTLQYGSSWGLQGGRQALYAIASSAALPGRYSRPSDSLAANRSNPKGAANSSSDASTTIIIVFPLNAANLTGGVRTIGMYSGERFDFNFEFDPPFMKTTEDILTFTFKYTWGRK